MKSLKTLTAAVFASASIAGGATAANAFANGGFETVGVGTAAEAWLPAASGYALSTDARTGNFAAKLESPAFNASIMLQNSVEQGGQPPLVAGDNPLLSFWAKGYAGDTGNVLFALRYLDSVGNILANSNNQFFQGSINTNTWTEITYDLGPVPVGATAAFIEFSQGLGPVEDAVTGAPLQPGLVLIDDLQLTVIPEPGSLALLGLGGLALARRRRRA